MTVTRKEFLATTAAGLAAATLAPRALLAGGVGVDAAQMKNAVGQQMHLERGDGTGFDVVLASYVDRPNPKTQQFTLTFQSLAGERVPEGTYTITSKSLGTMQVFLVPAGYTKGRASFRADYNLLGVGGTRK